jgi:hypothetical protein
MSEFFSSLFANALFPPLASAAAIAFAYVMKLIPNDKIKDWVGIPVEKFFAAVTVYMNSNKITKYFWEIFETWFVDFLDNVVANTIQSVKKGLRSDNTETSG